MENDFLENYFREITELISNSSKAINDLIDVKKTILLASKRGKKIIIAGIINFNIKFLIISFYRRHKQKLL